MGGETPTVNDSARSSLLETLLRWVRLAAPWLLLAAIVYATASPLDLRPRTGWVHLERFAAFGLLGFLYAIAFPRRITLASAIVFLAVAGLELLQLGLPDRHARFTDFAVKLAGGAVGIWIGWLSWRLFVRDQPARRRSWPSASSSRR